MKNILPTEKKMFLIFVKIIQTMYTAPFLMLPQKK